MKHFRLFLGVIAMAIVPATYGLCATQTSTAQTIVNPGNTVVGQGTVIDVQEDGTIVFVDMETGVIRVATAAGLNLGITIGETVTFIMITTPNGHEVIKQIKRVEH